MSLAPACSIAVTDYAAHARLPRHDHDEHWVSFVLCGGFIEESRGARHVATAGDLVIKPTGTSHANDFGARGARILSIRIGPIGASHDRWRAPAGFGSYRWRRDPARFGAAVALALAARAPASSRLELLDLEERALALACAAMEGGSWGCAPCAAPAWLGRVIERLADDPTLPSLDPLAELAGVHPVHLARVFRRCTGTTLRAFRRRLRVERAVDLLASSGRRLAEIAQAARFSDEAHLCRSLRRELGTTPGVLATLLRPRRGHCGP